MRILFLILIRPPDTETLRMVTMVTMVTMTMSATTMTPACNPFACSCCCACYNILMLTMVTMVQIYEQNRNRPTDPVRALLAHISCLLVRPPPWF